MAQEAHAQSNLPPDAYGVSPWPLALALLVGPFARLADARRRGDCSPSSALMWPWAPAGYLGGVTSSATSTASGAGGATFVTTNHTRVLAVKDSGDGGGGDVLAELPSRMKDVSAVLVVRATPATPAQLTERGDDTRDVSWSLVLSVAEAESMIASLRALRRLAGNEAAWVRESGVAAGAPQLALVHLTVWRVSHRDAPPPMLHHAHPAGSAGSSALLAAAAVFVPAALLFQRLEAHELSVPLSQSASLPGSSSARSLLASARYFGASLTFTASDASALFAALAATPPPVRRARFGDLLARRRRRQQTNWRGTAAEALLTHVDGAGWLAAVQVRLGMAPRCAVYAYASRLYPPSTAPARAQGVGDEPRGEPHGGVPCHRGCEWSALGRSARSVAQGGVATASGCRRGSGARASGHRLSRGGR